MSVKMSWVGYLARFRLYGRVGARFRRPGVLVRELLVGGGRCGSKGP